jgi:hypothetical protein
MGLTLGKVYSDDVPGIVTGGDGENGREKGAIHSLTLAATPSRRLRLAQ